MVDWHGLRVYGLQLVLPVPSLRVFPGHFLRGILGRVLFDTVCPFSATGEDSLCPTCSLRDRCAYPRVFKPVAPEQLAPFWLHGWSYRQGLLTANWHVLEDVRPHLEAWLHGLSRRFPAIEVRDATTGLELAGRNRVACLDLQPLPEPVRPGSACLLHMITPLVSKHSADPLHGALRTRVQRLIQQYGDGARLPIEETPWQIQVLADAPMAMRLGRRHVQGHLYSLRLTDLTPDAADLLAWGQRLQAGGHTSIGCGAYRLE